ncbi:MAG: LPS-assembly protein LptD [Bacteroidia bacterium]|nr:LPS-assembly protein LptD [Bacteroidia bacterium]
MIIRQVAIRVIPVVLAVVCFIKQGSAQQVDSSSTADSLVVGLKPGKDGLKAPVIYEATDSVRLDMKNKKVMLYKNAVVTYEDMKLEADFIEVSFETNDIHATGLPDSSGIVQGKPIFTTDGKPFNAEEMWYNFKTKKGISTGVVTTEDGGVIRGAKILKDSADNMYIKHAKYTTCNAEHPHFWISADRFKVVPEKQVISGPANLVIAGINTPLVLPFGFFPIQQRRSKGLIVGSLDQQDRWGYGLRDFGFYTPVNDYMDLLLSTDIYLRGSWGFSVKSNYKKRYKYSGLALFKFNKYLEGERESPDFQEVDNYRIEWVFRRDPKAKPGRNFTANVTYITKNQQKYASTDPNDIIATNANSSVAYSRSFANKKIFLTTNARIDQNLGTGDLSMELPQMNVNVQRLQPFKNMKGGKDKKKVLRNSGFTYTTAFRNNIQVNQDSIQGGLIGRNGGTLQLNPRFLEGVRNGIKHDARFSTSFSVLKYLNISPDVSLTDFWYFKTIEKVWDTDTLLENDVQGFSRAAAYSGGINLNTTIFGTKTFRKESRVQAIRHVIRPTLGMRWSPDYEGSFASGYRTVQTDTGGTITPYSIYENGIYRGPSGSANGSINIGINNNFEMKVKTPNDSTNGGVKKVKLLESLSFNSGYNFFADSLKLSPVAISGFTTLFNKVRVNFSAQMNPYAYVYDSTSERNVQIDKYAIEEGRLGQLTSGSLQLSTSLNPQALKRRANNQEGEFVSSSNYFMDFSIPWDLSLNYSSRFTRALGEDERVKDQTLMFNGNMTLTKYWKIGFSSGYNFSRKEPGITSIDFARDLHCWVFNFHWIPLGTYRQFNFELRVKAAKLKDLKIKRRDTWQVVDF